MASVIVPSSVCNTALSVSCDGPDTPEHVEDAKEESHATAVLAAVAVLAVLAAPVGAKSFGTLYAEGDVYRTFGTPAQVEPGTGTDPIYTFTNSTNPEQLSVARYAPGQGSHGGRWAVHHATWVDAEDADTLITDFETLESFASQGLLTIVRDEAADFRCPILPG